MVYKLHCHKVINKKLIWKINSSNFGPQLRGCNFQKNTGLCPIALQPNFQLEPCFTQVLQSAVTNNKEKLCFLWPLFMVGWTNQRDRKVTGWLARQDVSIPVSSHSVPLTVPFLITQRNLHCSLKPSILRYWASIYKPQSDINLNLEGRTLLWEQDMDLLSSL